MEMEMEMDGLSDDQLGLDLKEAAATSLRFVEMSGQIEATNRLKADVHEALATRGGAALESLTLFFCYRKCMASDVDVWAELAAKNKVQHLYLTPYSCRTREEYTLHQSMYSNSWLKQLVLSCCIMPLPTAMDWRSMTEISLNYCTLSQQVIDQIISGCPALTSLDISPCYKFNRLAIGRRSFRSLSIDFKGDGLLEISAPYMTDLNVAMILRTRTLRLTNVVSLRRVELRLRVDYYLRVGDEDDAYQIFVTTNNAYQIFDTIRCANILVLEHDTLKVVSMMATNGRQLPQLKAESLKLEIYADYDVGTLHGTLLVLESSPFLEMLDIYVFQSPWGKEAIAMDPTKECNLNWDLLYLKTVIVNLWTNTENSYESTFKLARTLLKRAPILEKMFIYISERHISASTNVKDLIKRFETLFSYPRSSHKARIVISEFSELEE